MGKSLNNNSIKHTLPSIYPSPWRYPYPSTLSLEVFGLLASVRRREGGGNGYRESSIFLGFCWEECNGGGRGFSLSLPGGAWCWSCWFLSSFSKVRLGLFLYNFFHYVWMSYTKMILHKSYTPYLFSLLPVSWFCPAARFTFKTVCCWAGHSPERASCALLPPKPHSSPQAWHRWAPPLPGLYSPTLQR